MKTWPTLLLLLPALFCNQGDTEILCKVEVLSDNAYRQETFSLKNKNSATEELVIEGAHSQSIYPKDNTDSVYKFETIYVADKDGYRVKYKLIREPHGPIDLGVRLNQVTLKSLAG